MSEHIYLADLVRRYCATHSEYDCLIWCENGANPDDGCACPLDDLMPCGEPGTRCQLGHRVPVPDEFAGEGITDWFAAGPRD